MDPISKTIAAVVVGIRGIHKIGRQPGKSSIERLRQNGIGDAVAVDILTLQDDGNRHVFFRGHGKIGSARRTVDIKYLKGEALTVRQSRRVGRGHHDSMRADIPLPWNPGDQAGIGIHDHTGRRRNQRVADVVPRIRVRRIDIVLIG